MRLTQGDGQRRRQNVHVGIRFLGSKVRHPQHLGVGDRINRLLAPLGIDVGLIPDLNVLHPVAKVFDKLVHKVPIVFKIGGWGFGTGFCGAGPRGRTIQAGDDDQVLAAQKVHDLVELGPTTFPADRIDKLALAQRLNLGPGELLLGPAQASFPGHLDRPLALPRLYLTG